MSEPENAFAKHLQLGRHYLSSHFPEKAVEQFRAALTLEPDDAIAHALMALALLDVKRLDASAHEADIALQLAPNAPFLFYVRGVVYGHAQKWKDAQSMLEKAIALDPDDADYHAHLAYIFFRQDKPKLAEKSARTALVLDPYQRNAHRFLALALLNLGQKDEALFHARRAVELEPQSDDSHSCLGLCLLRTGDTEGALHHISEALRLDPSNASAHHNLVLAMGAKNPFYGLLWRIQMLMGRLPQWGRVAVLVGLWSIMHFVDVLGDENPAFATWSMAIIYFYLAFSVYVWVAPSVFKAWLRTRGAI